MASLVPTFNWAIKSTCSHIDFSRDLVIVEYGAGTGVFTKYLLGRLTPRSRLIAIERNEEMYRILSRRVTDPRLHIVNDSAENVRIILNAQHLASADYIISGIPFSLFPEDLMRQIIHETTAALGSRGEFVVYQCLWTHKQQRLLECLKQSFKDIDSSAVLLNIPPLTVYRAKGIRPADGDTGL